MAKADKTDDLGYGKPPQRTQFAKGRSGNPKGRPKGSQNLATILAKAGRQRVRVTENGHSRYITKWEAGLLQLMNKAISGDLRAIGELRDWIKLVDSGEAAPTPFVPQEADKTVMASIIKRIRQSDDLALEDGGNPAATEPSRPKE